MNTIINKHNEATDDFLFHHSLNSKCEKNTVYGPETHTQFEVLYLVKGEIEYVIEGVVYPVKQNDIIIVPPNEMHSIKIKSQDYERIVILFDYDIIEAMLQKANITIDKTVFTNNYFYKIVQSNVVNDTNLKNIFLETAKLKNDALIRVKLISYIMQLICELSKIMTLEYVTPVTPIDANEVVKNATAFINENITKPLSIEYIAKNIGVSKSTLSHQFSSFMNVSLNKYITIKKIYLARSLIRKGVPATEACLMVGYTQYATFYQNYCKYIGVCPSTNKPI